MLLVHVCTCIVVGTVSPDLTLVKRSCDVYIVIYSLAYGLCLQL